MGPPRQRMHMHPLPFLSGSEGVSLRTIFGDASFASAEIEIHHLIALHSTRRPTPRASRPQMFRMVVNNSFTVVRSLAEA